MKQKIGRQNVLYPMPVTVVGAMVNGRPNFLTISHVGILNARAPHYISISVGKEHYTTAGIKENRTFSVNLPKRDSVIQVDYLGLVSGKNVDKSGLFEIVYGELETAPMIQDCPISMECRLYQTVDLPTHEVFIGEIVATYVDPAVMTDDLVDLAKLDPLLFDMITRQYWSLGEPIAKCWSVGSALKVSR